MDARVVEALRERPQYSCLLPQLLDARHRLAPLRLSREARTAAVYVSLKRPAPTLYATASPHVNRSKHRPNATPEPLRVLPRDR